LDRAPTITIVDDDCAVCDAIACFVRSLGYDTVTFSSAEEFLHSGRAATTDCVISDMHMPGLKGDELQARLIADGLRTPIIFVTAYPDEKLERRVLHAGAIAYMNKPFDCERLAACLDAAIKNDSAACG
jgi:FixJ family two-component response regulator